MNNIVNVVEGGSTFRYRYRRDFFGRTIVQKEVKLVEHTDDPEKKHKTVLLHWRDMRTDETSDFLDTSTWFRKEVEESDNQRDPYAPITCRRTLEHAWPFNKVMMMVQYGKTTQVDGAGVRRVYKTVFRNPFKKEVRYMVPFTLTKTVLATVENYKEESNGDVYREV